MARHVLTLCTALLGAMLAGCDRDAAPDVSQPTAAAPRVVAVAAASDLRFALDEAIAAFGQRQPGIEVRPTYGASGNLYAQLSNGAPFDLFFSADAAYPRMLIDAGLADPESEFVYALGHLVVWVPNDSPLDLEARGVDAITDPSVRKLAIANPAHAPYGRAAEAALRSLGVYDRVKDRLVLGENIAQTAQFVESGNADAGVIALSLALAPAMKDKGRFWKVPQDAHPPLEQGGVILRRAQDREAAEAFRAFVRGEGKAILVRYGFEIPAE